MLLPRVRLSGFTYGSGFGYFSAIFMFAIIYTVIFAAKTGDACNFRPRVRPIQPVDQGAGLAGPYPLEIHQILATRVEAVLRPVQTTAVAAHSFRVFERALAHLRLAIT